MANVLALGTNVANAYNQLLIDLKSYQSKGVDAASPQTVINDAAGLASAATAFSSAIGLSTVSTALGFQSSVGNLAGDVEAYVKSPTVNTGAGVVADLSGIVAPIATVATTFQPEIFGPIAATATGVNIGANLTQYLTSESVVNFVGNYVPSTTDWQTNPANLFDPNENIDLGTNILGYVPPSGTLPVTTQYTNTTTGQVMMVSDYYNQSLTAGLGNTGGELHLVSSVVNVYTDSTLSTPISSTLTVQNSAEGTVTTTVVNYNPDGTTCTYSTDGFNANSASTSSGTTPASIVSGTATDAGVVQTANVQGQGAVVYATNADVTLAAGSQATLIGSGNTTVAGTGATLALSDSSNNDAVTMGSGGTVSIADGDHGEVVNETGGVVTVGNGSAVTVVGNDAVNSGTGSTLSLVGSDTINGTSGYVYLAAGVTATNNGTGMTINTASNDVVIGNGATINVGANLAAGQSAGNTTIDGNDVVNAGTGNTLSLVGNDTINGTNGYVYLAAGVTATNNGTGMVINTASNDVVIGNGATINVGANLAAGQTAGNTTIDGNDVVNAGTGNTLSLAGNDTINGTNGYVYLAAGVIATNDGTGMTINTASNDVVIGNGATVNVGTNLAAGQSSGVTTIEGDNTVNGGTGNVVALVGNNTLNGTNDYVYLAPNETTAANGTGLLVNTAANDVVIGNGLTVDVGGNGGGYTGNTTVIGDAAVVNDLGNKDLLSLVGNDITVENDAQGTDIYLGSNTTITDKGTNDVILTASNDGVAATGDTLVAGGNGGAAVGTLTVAGANTIDAGAGNVMTLAGNISVYHFDASTNAVTSDSSSAASGGSIDNSSDDGGGSEDSSDGGGGGGSTTGQTTEQDPIILNLQGQSVQTVGLSNSSAYFDMQNNGQQVQTGWATAGEGMLVFDPNNTGTVTDDASLVAGFGELSTLANQTSGVLDASNLLWNELKVWVDPTGNANFQQGDLYSLNQLGISSINLSSTAEQANNNGNTILNDSTFTWNNGSTGDIAGVSLAFNPNVTASSTVAGSTPNATLSASLNHLIQSMATFTDGNTGIEPTFSAASANADTTQLVASSVVQHA